MSHLTGWVLGLPRCQAEAETCVILEGGLKKEKSKKQSK